MVLQILKPTSHQCYPGSSAPPSKFVYIHTPLSLNTISAFPFSLLDSNDTPYRPTHAFNHAPPAANSTAAPIAPVRMGIAAPEVLDEAAAAVEVATMAPPPSVVVGVGTPEVKGTEAAEVAPAKATAVVEALGVRVVALGLRTLEKCQWRVLDTA